MHSDKPLAIITREAEREKDEGGWRGFHPRTRTPQQCATLTCAVIMCNYTVPATRDSQRRRRRRRRAEQQHYVFVRPTTIAPAAVINHCCCCACCWCWLRRRLRCEKCEMNIHTHNHTKNIQVCSCACVCYVITSYYTRSEHGCV